MELINKFSESPVFCIIFSHVFGLLTIGTIRQILRALMTMHRSDSNLKSIQKNSSFWEKLFLVSVWDHCLHAKAFSRVMIYYHHFRSVVLVFSLAFGFACLLISSLTEAYIIFCILSGLFFDLPVQLLHLILEKYPFIRRRNEYRFKKYDHTSERNKLL